MSRTATKCCFNWSNRWINFSGYRWWLTGCSLFQQMMLTLFGPGKIFRLMAQGGIDSTPQIQTLITPEQQKIKNPFLLLEKLNFLTKSPNFLSLCLQPWSSINLNISQGLSEAIGSLFICTMLISVWLPWRGIAAGGLFSNSEIITD